MPSFGDTARSAAPPEEVWKLLGDSARFPEWWVDTASGENGNGRESFTLDYTRDGRTVMGSCQVSELRLEWRLEPEEDGTRIDVLVDVPEDEAFRLDEQREVIRRSLERLAEVAAVATL